MKAELEKTLSTQPRDHWLELFLGAGLAAGPVRGLGDVLEDEQLRHRNMLTTITIPPTGSAGAKAASNAHARTTTPWVR